MADAHGLGPCGETLGGSSPLVRTSAKQIMYKVYTLRSLINRNKTYVGKTTKEINKRLKEHNDGLSRFTKTDRPWELIYYETFYCDTCTDKREKFLKSGIGYRFKKIILENYERLR